MMLRKLFRPFDPNATVRQMSMVEMRIEREQQFNRTVKLFRSIIYLTAIVILIAFCFQAVP